MARQDRCDAGYSLLEMLAVLLLIGVLIVVVVPYLVDLRSGGKDGATKAALGTYRTAIAVAASSIGMREDPNAGVPKFPTREEMLLGRFNESHPVMNGTHILDSSEAASPNPWTLATLPESAFRTIIDCEGLKKGALNLSPFDDRGWCYDESSGAIWPNTDNNGAGPGKTENTF